MKERHRKPLLGAVEHFLGNVDRKSTRLNSSHSQISYAVFCLKKKSYRDRKHAIRCGNWTDMIAFQEKQGQSNLRRATRYLDRDVLDILHYAQAIDWKLTLQQP